ADGLALDVRSLQVRTSRGIARFRESFQELLSQVPTQENRAMERQARLSSLQEQEKRYRELSSHWLYPRGRAVCQVATTWETPLERAEKEEDGKELYPNIGREDLECHGI